MHSKGQETFPTVSGINALLPGVASRLLPPIAIGVAMTFFPPGKKFKASPLDKIV